MNKKITCYALILSIALTGCEGEQVGKANSSETIKSQPIIVSSNPISKNISRQLNTVQPVKDETKKEVVKDIHKEVKVNKPVAKKASFKIKNKEDKISDKPVSRGCEKVITAEVTAYYISPSETGKSRNHPDYGKTASGTKATVGRTIAMSRLYKFGTLVEINGKVYRVEDRGGAIKGKKIDLLVKSSREAKQWGRRTIKVKIISTGDGKTHFKK